jgi:N-methylhydantoinase A
MSLIVGIDIGGTFTDVVGYDTDRKKLFVTKVSSTPQDHAVGFKQGLKRIMSLAGCKEKDLSLICHGTTVGTNAILERKGAKIGILTTKGFEDVLVIGRQKRSSMYDLFIDPETPIFLAPRRRIIGIPERVDSKGQIIEKMDWKSLEKALDHLIREEGVNSICVNYLFSFLNPQHEQETKKVLGERYPGVRASLSSVIDPRFREYERLCLAAFDAYIGPVLENYLKNIQTVLAETGIRGKLQVMQSRGGITGFDTVLEKAVSTILSGPAAGVVGCNFVGQVIQDKNLITMDMGGTSCDAALIQDGRTVLTTDGKIDKYPLRLPMLDVNTIGAGGGSIAWIDDAGGLRVGPVSAGAHPGPACYGHGGTEPTVTDASVTLGYLNPRYFAGGDFDLNPELAARSIGEKIASPLGLAIPDAAMGIHRIINAKMADQLRLISVGKGQDPRKFSLVAMGGAGPVHAGELAETLSIRRVVVPFSPGVLSAFGLLVANIEHDHAKTAAIKENQADPVVFNEIFRELDRVCSDKMEKDGIPISQVEIRKYAEMRYIGQAYEIEILLPEGQFSRESIGEAVRRFHEAHEAIYGHHDSASPVEFVSLRAVHSYSPAKPVFPRVQRTGSLSESKKGERNAYFDSGKSAVKTPVYDRWKIPTGERIKGPGIIEQEDTTTVIYPNHEAHMDEYGNILIEVR